MKVMAHSKASLIKEPAGNRWMLFLLIWAAKSRNQRRGIDKLTWIVGKWSRLGYRHAAAVATTQLAIALALR